MATLRIHCQPSPPRIESGAGPQTLPKLFATPTNLMHYSTANTHCTSPAASNMFIHIIEKNHEPLAVKQSV